MSKKRPASRSVKSESASKSSVPFLSLLLSGSAILFGIYRAIELRWISDDAFITMRYVKNFLDGHGLVYNTGERVEGYTHFLWLLLLSAAGALGFDPVDASIWLGIVSFIGILVLLVFVSYRETRQPRSLWFPLAAVLFALNYDNVVWASGGLETSMYAMLLLSTFAIWFYAKYQERQRLLLSGLLAAFATLTRPDGALFIVVGAILLLVRSRKDLMSGLRKSAWFGLPSVVIGVPYLLWKLYYYGDLLPLTFYAKSAGGSYFSQGLYYIWLYFRVYFVFGILSLVGLVFLWRKQHVESDLDRGSPQRVAAIVSLTYLLLFVARTGGDFMFARFIIPIVPFLLIMIECSMQRVVQQKYHVAVVIILFALGTLENNLRDRVLFHSNEQGHLIQNWNLTGEGSTHGIADERWTYYYGHFKFGEEHRGTMEVYSEIGKYLEPFFRGLHMTVAIPGAMNMIAYYANFENCINEYGLTDSFIAHRPVQSRARIGHEKEAPEEYLKQRHTNFELSAVVAQPPTQLSTDDIVFDIPTLGLSQLGRLITYDSTTMNELSNRLASADNRTKLPLFELLIPYYISNTLPSRSLIELEGDYSELQKFYFSRYPNQAQQQAFERRIAYLRDSSRTK